jgi:hypothetical protein
MSGETKGVFKSGLNELNWLINIEIFYFRNPLCSGLV